MDAWIWWLIAATALVVAELFTGTIVLLMFGAGALAASVAGILGAEIWLQVVVFTVVTAFSLWLVRPWINRRLHRNQEEIGLAKVEGSQAQVVERVDRGSGMVKIGGELWRARPHDVERSYDPGDWVKVIEVDGATALVGKD